MLNKVAIVQNKIIWGGRLDLLVHLIKYLNQKQIVPDIITFKVPQSFNKNKIFSMYNLDVNYKLKIISSILSKTPHEYNIFVFNLLLHYYCKNYNLIINSSNTDIFMPQLTTISYIHFPREARAISNYESIHSFNPKTKAMWNISWFNNVLIRKIYLLKNNINIRTVVVCNSKFTKNNFISCYSDRLNSKVKVIYPTYFSIKNENIHIKKRQIIHTARFVPDKLQLELIRLAATLPDIEFRIVGFKDSRSVYATKCQNELEKLKINNVKLYFNLTNEELNELLKESLIYLSTTPNEPFGLGILHAVTLGNCLPIIPNSGGQCEIVPFNKLQYNNFAELKNKLITILADEVLFGELRQKVFEYSRHFSYKEFCKNFDEVLNGLIK